MELTQNKFTGFKQDYLLKKKRSTTGRYGNKSYEYVPVGTIHVMWTPITDDASIAEYGEKVDTMLQAVFYDEDFHTLDRRLATEAVEGFATEDYGDSLVTTEVPIVEEHDRVEVLNGMYEVVSALRYNTHTLIKVQKV